MESNTTCTRIKNTIIRPSYRNKHPDKRVRAQLFNPTCNTALFSHNLYINKTIQLQLVLHYILKSTPQLEYSIEPTRVMSSPRNTKAMMVVNFLEREEKWLILNDISLQIL